MTTRRPIEIVGGGLAGLSLGLALRRAGAAVTIFETASYPRHRVCGEFITGLSGVTIEKLGLASSLEGTLSHREMAWFSGPGPARIHRLPEPALGVSRHTLDARLAEAFLNAGGDLRTGTRVNDLNPRAGRVVATGRRPGKKSPWIGLKIHLHDFALLRPLEFHLGEHAYVGLSQVENGTVNLCGLFKRRKLSAPGADLIGAYLEAAGLKKLAQILSKAQPEPDSFCAVAAISFDQRVPVQTGVTLGDSCAMIPPFTGNGMAMAFQSAEAALDPLLAYTQGEASWPETCRTIQRLQIRRFRVRLASAHFLHPYLLQPTRQRWLAAIDRVRLLPFRPIYSALH